MGASVDELPDRSGGGLEQPGAAWMTLIMGAWLQGGGLLL